ncbi:AbrB/MazE/SpoVT family DNA-binding domain-containing protein [Candidatus Pacearchaeota archaeon]|nr:AbrB/MazE/SpoVT family DNA-binding domain-containing protein [Candidatus Pacearchaeota archaeon]
MRFVREIGEKGQVVIPRDIRDLLGVRPKQKIVFEVENEEVKIKQEEDAEKFLKEFFSLPKLKKPLTLKDLKKIEDESYDLP